MQTGAGHLLIGDLLYHLPPELQQPQLQFGFDTGMTIKLLLLCHVGNIPALGMLRPGKGTNCVAL